MKFSVNDWKQVPWMLLLFGTESLRGRDPSIKVQSSGKFSLFEVLHFCEKLVAFVFILVWFGLNLMFI